MGSKYNVSDEDMAVWHKMIIELAEQYKVSRSKFQYYILIIWIYEYIEVSIVNGTNLHAGLKPVKEDNDRYKDELVNLFHIRNQCVHSPYSIDDRRLATLIDNSLSINTVLRKYGFEEDVL